MSGEKFQNKYRIESARLKNWDYGSPGFYFVTICTKNREWFFGDIVSSPEETQNFASLPDAVSNPVFPRCTPSDSAFLNPTPIGAIAHQYWTEIPQHFPFVKPDEFIIMPNHVHGIISICKSKYNQWNKNKFAPQSQNLASVIRGYKAAVKKYATTNNIKFLWQPRYHESVIRTAYALENIRRYIINNPAKWIEDQSDEKNKSMQLLMR